MEQMGGEEAASELKGGIDINPDFYWDSTAGSIFTISDDGVVEFTGYNVSDFGR